jgi:uncharacterized protein YjbI with pentapeptide repeats
MANPEHVAILKKKGVEAWNAWRETHFGTRPSLYDADLHGAHLHGADLSWSDLYQANLRGSDLSKANLSGSDLSKADLTGADLSGAVFDWAKMAGAKIGGVNLSGAMFLDQDFTSTDLSGVNLHGANLSGLVCAGHDLSGHDLRETRFNFAKLSGVNLRWADLSRQEFGSADLSQAGLHWADLSGADLNFADLSGADLSYANLREAGLWKANLNQANLNGADLTDAKIMSTSFGDVDLSSVKGLETVQHDGHSTIGIDTLHKSQGMIPEAFLRGTGVPEQFLPYARLLAGTTGESWSTIFRYSIEDRKMVDKLYADFCSLMPDFPVRLAPGDLKIGNGPFQRRIHGAMCSCDLIIVIFSKASIPGPWIEGAVYHALEREKIEGRTVLFPIAIDDPSAAGPAAWTADMLRQRHIEDFTNWQDPHSGSMSFHQFRYHLSKHVTKATPNGAP